MLRAALPRLFALLGVVVGGTAALSAALGALAAKSVLHAMAIGYYLVGAVVLIGCLVVGSRGPLRRGVEEDDEEEEVPVVAPTIFGGAGLLRRRSVRKTTSDERRQAVVSSLGLFALALALILLGAVLDPARHAF